MLYLRSAKKHLTVFRILKEELRGSRITGKRIISSGLMKREEMARNCYYLLYLKTGSCICWKDFWMKMNFYLLLAYGLYPNTIVITHIQYQLMGTIILLLMTLVILPQIYLVVIQTGADLCGYQSTF